MHKCGLYTRVSTDLQAFTKEGSLDTQLDMLEKFVELKNGTTEDEWIIAEIYREEGRSGKDTDRPEYQRMIQDIQHGRTNSVLCSKIDRVSRSIVDFMNFHQLLEEYGVTFISLSESWDTSTAMGKFALTITLAAAQLEREQTAERTREKMQWRAEQGLSNGGRILGYDIDPDNPGIPPVNEKEKALLLLIYETFVKEKCFKRVAKIMNEKGYRTKSYVSRRGRVQGGKKFMGTTIERLLTNLFYIGKIVHKGEVFDGRHEPVVPLELWEKVQAIIASNQQTHRKPRKQLLHTYLLQGLVRCGKCNSLMTPYYGFNAAKVPYFYYACDKQLKFGKDDCDMRPVSAKALEDVIARILMQLKDDDKLVTDMIHNASFKSSTRLTNLTQTRDTLSGQKTQLEQQISMLVDSLAKGADGVKSVSQRIVELEEQKEQIVTEMRELDAQRGEAKRKVVSFDTVKDTLTTFSTVYTKATPEEKKELMRLHIHQLVWTPREIRLALFEQPTEHLNKRLLTTPGYVQSVETSGSPTVKSTEPLFMWDDLDIFQRFRNRSPFFNIGLPPSSGPKIFPNPITIAQQYKDLLDSGLVQSQTDLAQLLGVSRAKVTQMLNLLKLDEEIQEYILGLDETDGRLKVLTEWRLRELVKIEDGKVQLERFGELVSF